MVCWSNSTPDRTYCSCQEGGSSSRKSMEKPELVVDKEILSRARDVLSHLVIQEAKTSSYRQRVADCGNDQRALFQLMDECLLKKPDPNLPKHDTQGQLAERFSLYFMSKISNIRTAWDASADTWTQPAEGNREVDQPASFLLNFWWKNGEKISYEILLIESGAYISSKDFRWLTRCSSCFNHQPVSNHCFFS